MAWILVAIVGVGFTTVEAETERIQSHLRTVERELVAADVSALSPGQRSRRAALIDELDRYRNRGLFPRNLDFEDPTPYFIDDRGVRCAMAHLIETANGGPIVARVAATANNAYVRELALDGELLSWLATNGLTLAEAARIQPSYPNAVGAWCDLNGRCESGLCVPVDANPEFSYCSSACDPAVVDSCPSVSPSGAPMECAEAGDSHICQFVEPTMEIGERCDPDDAAQCVGDCLWQENGVEEDAICTRQCSPFDDSCPDGYECGDAGNIEFSWCFPAEDASGCNATRVNARESLFSLACIVLAALAVSRWRRPQA